MPPLAIIFVTVFVDLLGFGIIIPLLPFYAESYGATGLHVGLLATVFSAMQFVFAPIWGRWSDRIGRRPIIIAGLVGSCLSYVVLALADSLLLIFFARVVGGIAGANIPVAQAYIADVTTPDNRARGMGLVGAAFGLGFVFGPAIGGTLSRFGPDVPMWTAAALCLANAVAAWLLLPESLSQAISSRETPVGRLEQWRRSSRNRQLVLLLALYFIITAAFSGFESTFALFSEQRFGYTAVTIGYIFAFIGVILAVVQGLLVGRLVKVVRERHLLPVAIFCIACGIALVAAAGTVSVLLLALGMLAFGMGLNSPVLSSMVSRASGANEQGSVLGLAQSLASLGRVAGPAWGGFLFDRAGATFPHISSAMVMAVALVIALYLARSPGTPTAIEPQAA